MDFVHNAVFNMDVVEIAEAVDHLGAEQRQQRRQLRALVRQRRMADPILAISDEEFRKNFRYSKEHALRLLHMLHADLSHEDGRGDSLTPLQQLCIALNYYGGGMYQRVAALCGGVSQPTVHRCIAKVCIAV